MAKELHSTAIVSLKAKIANDVYIGPFCIVGDGVVIKRRTRLLANVVIEGNTEIGEDCIIYPFTSIGLPPQDIKYKNEKTGVKIGKKNIIREYVTIHRASTGGDGLTEIGDSNFLMAYVHIAHDCKIGSFINMANVATLAGHVTVQSHANIGGLAAIHQFTRIGAYSMVGGFSGIGKDIPPYTVAAGARAKLHGINATGLKRQGFSDETIRTLKRAYRTLFREKRTMRDALEKIKSELPETAEIKQLVEFIEKSKRGICR